MSSTDCSIKMTYPTQNHPKTTHRIIESQDLSTIYERAGRVEGRSSAQNGGMPFRRVFCALKRILATGSFCSFKMDWNGTTPDYYDLLWSIILLRLFRSSQICVATEATDPSPNSPSSPCPTMCGCPVQGDFPWLQRGTASLETNGNGRCALHKNWGVQHGVQHRLASKDLPWLRYIKMSVSSCFFKYSPQLPRTLHIQFQIWRVTSPRDRQKGWVPDVTGETSGRELRQSQVFVDRALHNRQIYPPINATWHSWQTLIFLHPSYICSYTGYNYNTVRLEGTSVLVW